MTGHITCKPLGHYFVRAYSYQGFKEDFMLAQQFNFEYQILNEARKNKCQHIVFMGDVKFSDHEVFFVLKGYEMDLRSYLQKHREARKLSDILLQVLSGLRELHRLGFVHRDLKPENIVLNSGNPLKVAIIDFDRALPVTCKTKSGSRGTPGYEPENFNFEDGDPQWDLYSLVAIIAECDMGVNTYLKVKNEREGKAVLKKHIEDK